MNYQVLPDLSAEDYALLKRNIAEHGVLVAVEYDDAGNILDGHHRVRVCEELGIQTWPRIIRLGLSEAEKRAHARQLNLARRHLTSEQKRTLIEDQLRETPSLSNRQIAEQLGVSHPTVGTVRDELEATGKIYQLETTIGADGRARPARRPYALVDESPEGRRAALNRAKEIKADEQEVRRVERIENLKEVSRGNSELPTDRRYPIIYADPPWQYENGRPGSAREIENHYPTMSLDEICALPVADLATPDAVLFLWTTSPHLAEALQVIDAWGFTYKTNVVWVKDRIGPGFYVRNQHELLLIARRGEPPLPHESSRPPSVIHAPRGEHSAKPVEAYEIIERMYPELPKIELFARNSREGWAAWGNQAEVVAA